MRSYNLYQYNLSGAGPGYPPGFASGGVVIVNPNFKPGSDFPDFTVGSRGMGVETAQTLLNARGGAKLVADGVFGEQTKTAVAAYQKVAGITVTGAFDDRTWGRLLPTLTRGATGPVVEAIQRELRAAGATITPNGTFDAATEKAVRDFQSRHRIKVTGTVSSVTWARLLA